MAEVETYLDFHPFREWTVDRWDEETAIIDARFHREDVYFTPLIGSSLVMPAGVDWDGTWRVNNEIVQAHVNHNTIGRYQRMMGPLYVDTRYRVVSARERWGSKIQLDRRDTMVSRFGNDTPTFIREVLRSQMANDIVAQTERIARDGMINNSQFNYLYDGTAWNATTANFSDIPRSSAGLFDIKIMEEVALRMSYRTEYSTRQWGTYAQPVPGSNFRGSVLIMMSTGSYWGIWNSEEQQYMIDLRQLQDGRIINGGQVQYRNFSTIQEAKHATVLWNAGTINAQVAVTSPIKFGDGATDPDSANVDSVYYMGQTGADVTHYIQCSAFGATDFRKGDFVSIHKARTSSWGIDDGVDFLDGDTVVAEVYSVDADNERIVLREPITNQYEDAFPYTTLNNVASSGQAYAYVTRAQHIHPVFIVGAREMVQFVHRRQPDGSLIEYNRPTDTNVDFPSIERVTANWYGGINVWQPDTVEIFFCAAPFANRGDLEF